jgi:hypothetical protein
LLVSFVVSLISLCQYMIAAGRAIIRCQGGKRCVYGAGMLYCLYVIVGNGLQPGATVMTVVSATGMVCSAGTVVIVAASTAKSWRSNRRRART